MQYLKIALSIVSLAFLVVCSATTPAPTIPDAPTVGTVSNTGGTIAGAFAGTRLAGVFDGNIVP